MGFARRAVRKSVRRATPRSVRRAMHPARTAKNAVTPRPVKQVSRAAYTVRHAAGAAENAMIGAALYPPRRKRGGWLVAIGVIGGLVTLAVLPWWFLPLLILALVILFLIVRRRARRDVPPRPAPPPAPWPYLGPSGGGSILPQPRRQPPPQARPDAGWRRVEPWPADRAFRSTPPPDVTPRPEPYRAPQSAGEWELEVRRHSGLGDGSQQ
jgi:hypothetical protein